MTNTTSTGVHEIVFSSDRAGLSFEVNDLRLQHLIQDAAHAYRVYELFAIRRPADVLKYLNVVPGRLPATVDGRVNSKFKDQIASEGCIPYLDFDGLFILHPEDAEIWDDEWRFFSCNGGLRDFVRQRLLEVAEVRVAIRDSEDLLLNIEARKIYTYVHPKDWEQSLPYVQTPADYCSPAQNRAHPQFFEKLQGLLALPEVRSVSCRGKGYYDAFQAICREQVRRKQEKRPDITINALTPSGGIEGCWRPDWTRGVRWWDEGLVYGDLFVDARCSPSWATAKELVEQRDRIQSRYVLLDYPLDAPIEKYDWVIEAGYSFGIRQDPFTEDRYCALNQIYNDQQ